MRPARWFLGWLLVAGSLVAMTRILPVFAAEESLSEIRSRLVNSADGLEAPSVQPAASLLPQARPAPRFVPNEFLVKFRSAKAADRLRSDQARATQQSQALQNTLSSSALVALAKQFSISVERATPVFPGTSNAAQSAPLRQYQTEFSKVFRVTYTAKQTVSKKSRSKKNKSKKNKPKKSRSKKNKKNTSKKNTQSGAGSGSGSGKDEVDVEQICAFLNQQRDVEYAEPNALLELFASPNDPYYQSSNSWGQGYDDLWGLKNIKAGDAWNLTTGSADVVVAVVDSGVDYHHEDLSANVWVNPCEDLNGNGVVDPSDFNGVDDACPGHMPNGYVDDIRGWDSTTCEQFGASGCVAPKPEDNDPLDTHGHGTHVSGTIGAVTNNGLGMAGVSWHSRIMPVRALGSGGGSLADIAAGINYAISNGADVINASFGAGGSSLTMEEVVGAALANDIIFVAAAGNSDEDAARFFPANINGVLTVAAANQHDVKTDFSNWGSVVDVSAPGGDSGFRVPGGIDISQANILSLRANGTDMFRGAGGYSAGDAAMGPGGRYYRALGTSMAAPHVSGLAALVRAYYPQWNGADVRNQIVMTTDDIAHVNPAHIAVLGSGRINSYQALTMQRRPVLRVSAVQVSDPTGNHNQVLDPGETIALVVTLKNLWAPVGTLKAKLTTADRYVTIQQARASYGKLPSGKEADNAESPYVLVASQKTPKDHTVDLELDVSSTKGRFRETLKLSLRVPRLVVVDANGRGDYATIEDAFSAALPGDTIFIVAGKYTLQRSAWLRTDSVHIIGEDRDATTIRSTGPGVGFAISDADDVIVENLTFSNTPVFLRGEQERAERNTIRNCRFIDNNADTTALYVLNADRNVIEHNVIDNIETIGMYLIDSHHNVLRNNTIKQCRTIGLLFAPVADAAAPSGNAILFNTFMDNGYGTAAGMGSMILGGAENRFEGNAFSGTNGYGVMLLNANESLFFRNGFLNSSIQHVGSMGSRTVWDKDGEGNYWDDYAGVDVDGDSIGDEPYRVPLGAPGNPVGEEQDHAPFTQHQGWLRTQEVVLKPRFSNLVSFHYLGGDRRVETVFAELIDVRIPFAVQTNDGHREWIYSPSAGIFDLTEIVPERGYRVWWQGGSSRPITISVRGVPVSPTAADPLTVELQGPDLLNHLGYPYATAHPVEQVFSSMRKQGLAVNDDQGRFYIPQYGVNTIGGMQPGKGYEVTTSGEGVTLVFPVLD